MATVKQIVAKIGSLKKQITRLEKQKKRAAKKPAKKKATKKRTSKRKRR